MEEVITTRKLEKSFRTKRGVVAAVRGVDIGVARGEIFGFLGPDGAGKTTTLRMLTTLLPSMPAAPLWLVWMWRISPKNIRQKIGYVSQLGGADDLATGRENIVLQGRLYGGDPEWVKRRAGELVELLDLSEFADRRVITYSGGQRRRLDVALGIVPQPPVLFLDEPSTGLDPQNRANLWEHIYALREQGTTIFLTTHYLEEADILCDRVMIIDHGRIVAEGTPRDLKRQVAGDGVLISMKDGDGAAERAERLFREQPYVRDVILEGDHIRLYVEDGSSALPHLLRLLDKEGLGLRTMSLSEPTLDDVFLRATGHSLRDAGATEATEGLPA